MNSPVVRTKILLIGCDYSAFLVYWQLFTNQLEMDIVGFVNVNSDEEPPLKQFKGNPKCYITIFSKKNLEKVILKHKVQKCYILAQNISLNNLSSIIHRIIGAGNCTIEFLKPNQVELPSYKPIIVINSLSKQSGKTQMARYCTIMLNKNERKVAVIIPICNIAFLNNNIEPLNTDKSPHYEFSSRDEVPNGLFSQDIKWQIQNYFSCGAFRVYVTTDIRRALIQAEQFSDIIIYDAFECEIPHIKSNYKICVATLESLKSIKKHCLWPGLVNIDRETHIAIVKNGLVPPNSTTINKIQRIFKNKKLFFVKSIPTLEDSSGFEIFNKKVLTIGNESTKFTGNNVAVSMGASEVIDPSPFLTEGLEAVTQSNTIIASIPHASSPTAETEERTNQTMEMIAQAVNKSNADIIIVSLPNDIPGIDPSIQVLYTSPEINDDENNSLYNWLSQFFVNTQKPPLQQHFEAQVDILKSLAESTDKELYVSNNTSANREALCRLFLSSHLPPGFRVINGEIIDASGHYTGQLEVVIVNSSAPTMTIDNTNSVIAPILADSVLAVLEVKTNMTCEALKRSLSQLRPVKALMPMHETLESPDGHIIEDPLGGKIITGVFAFNLSNEVDSKIPEIIKLYPNVADFIVLLDGFGYYSAEMLKICGFQVNDDEVINGYVRHSQRGMGLAFIFAILNYFAATRRFNGSNCFRYLYGCWRNKFGNISRMRGDFEKNYNTID